MGRMAAKRSVSPLKVLGIVLSVALILGGLWAGWTYVGTNILARNAHRDGIAELEEYWNSRPTADSEEGLPLPVEGEPVWILEIPSLDGRWPIIAGVGDESLERGVGWYPTSMRPGQPGNMALAGNRFTEGEPFRYLLDLEVGDEVVVESHLARYTYTVRVAPASLTVDSDESWVLDPVPGKEFEPHEAVLTLTTDQDLYPTPDRSVGFAVLTHEEPK